MGLGRYLVRKLIALPILLFIISVVIFSIAHLSPGDPIEIVYMTNTRYLTSADLAAIRAFYGLDQPLYVQFFKWLWAMMNGDMGFSYTFNRPVFELVTDSLMNTVRWSVPAVLLSLLISIPCGVISATKQYSKTDYAVMISSLTWWCMPWFWYGLMMIFIFSVIFHVFPTGAMMSVGQETNLFDQLSHLVLPVVVLGTASSGFLTRMVRSCMLEVLRQDYIMTARMKGLNERIVIYRHALRNAMLPVVTVISLWGSLIVGGSAVLEVVFSWPGMGRLIVQASLFRDYPLILGANLTVAVFLMSVFILTDVIYAYVDPRIKY
jgi:peptide/nickel transport system permease protein